MKRVLVIGGYGNFGGFISKALSKDNKVQLIIAGRSVEKARRFIKYELNTSSSVEFFKIDIDKNFSAALKKIKADIVIHTSGPFQGQSYKIAVECIALGINYIDLADSRSFVTGISDLHAKARQAGVAIISGASSVPCFSSAIVDHFANQFSEMDCLEYGISTAQKANPGLATTAAILTYTGKSFTTLVNGKLENVYGWQGLKSHKFSQLGGRLLGYCDIPDLELFPNRYPSLKSIRFYAGLEVKCTHLMLWLLSWGVRLGLIGKLNKSAKLLLWLSSFFNFMGTESSGFYMLLSGKDKEREKSILFELTAHSGDGSYIPCMPAILLAKKMAADGYIPYGAYPCVGLISYEDYLASLSSMDISWELTTV